MQEDHACHCKILINGRSGVGSESNENEPIKLVNNDGTERLVAMRSTSSLDLRRKRRIRTS
jgi:hypothetical protein